MQSRWSEGRAAPPTGRGLFSPAGRAAIWADVLAWSAEQSRTALFWRGALWLYLLVAGVRLVFAPQTGDIFGLITLAIHEMGHVLFGFLGEFIGIAGGSIAQVLAPLYTLTVFWRQRDYFALGVGGYWLASSLFNLSVYIADARAQELELVSPFSNGGEPIHDWNYLLTHLHLLRFDTALSWLVRIDATLVFALAMGWSARVLWSIARR